jgi:Mitochondrial carrier protein
MVDSYVSYADCLVTTIQNHGLASLYSGGLARLAWIVPFTVIYLPTYDFLKQQLLQRHHVLLAKSSLSSSSFQEQEAAAAAAAAARASTSTFTTATVTIPLETV